MQNPSTPVGLRMGPASHRDPLRILIVSTGKTGNTWVEALLATLYRLPIVQVRGVWRDGTFRLDREEVEALGPRWIAHQHFHPHAELLEWACEPGVHLVTTVRHPGDVLVSLFHYALNGTHDAATAPAMLAYLSTPARTPHTAPTMHDQEAHVAAFVREWFSGELAISLGWVQSGAAYPVRYEDLWLDPVRTLRTVTKRIEAAPLHTIEHAIEQCDIGLMRDRAGDHKALFRKGGIGEWRSALPAGILDLFRHRPPYPAQFAALGYGLDPDDPLYSRPPRLLPSANSLQWITHFDNGVPVPPIVAQLFLALDAAAGARWTSFEQTVAPDSFYAWLNAPADDDPGDGDAAPRLTNLALYLYRIRDDLIAAFPDVFGDDRAAFLTWYCRYAPTEFALDDAFIAPIEDGLRAWQTPMPSLTAKTTDTPRRWREQSASLAIWRWMDSAARRFALLATHH